MNGRHTLLEGKGLELLGQDPKVLTQASVYEVFQNRPEILGYIQQAMQGDLVTATTEYAGQLVEVHFEPIWAENHVVEGVVAVANVITDVKKVQAKLLKSEENLRKVLDILPVGVWIADKDGKITHSNPAGRQTWSGARYVGPDEFHEYKAWWMPSRKPVQPDEWGIARAVTRGETSLEEELEIECFDGTHKIILNWASPILGPNHEIVGAVAVNQDITARKQAEEMLVAREKRFRALIESSSDAISLLDDRGKVLYESPSYTRIMGYREEERIGRDSFDLVHPEDYHRTAQMFAELLEHPGRVAIQPTRVKHGDGSWHWIEGVANNLLSEPAVRAIVINFRDITERKRAETALLEWEAQLETVTQNTPDTILQVDSGGIIRFINRAASGFAIEDVIGTSIYEWVPDEQHAILAQTLDAVFSTGGHGEYETPGRGQGAEERFYHVRVMPVTVGGKTISAIYTATDITARKKTEEELRRSIQEKEMLMHELQHRVKNSLAIAASLLGLEEANLADEKARAIFASAQLRLSSMSAVYELLYKSGGIDKIELDEYIKNLVSGLSKSYITTAEAITIQTQLEKVQLDLKRALQLGLILNELITNALKYAFPAGASGTISIRLTESAGKVTLCVADNGVGLPDGELQHTGMGLELVGMLTEQINGEFTIQNHHGCTAQLVFGLE
jgi:PAS domain S-box-containing protein